MERLYEKVMDVALRRLILYPSNEIYGGVAGFYDFGNIGAKIKRKIENRWREFFIRKHGYYEMESAIITPEITLKASGHVDEFTDPVVECKRCGRKYRADKLVEERESYVWEGNLEELKEKIEKLGIKCPECGGELGEPYLVNLMFSTSIGYDGTKGYLRPETAQGIFTGFKRLMRSEGSLPIAVGQVGRSFRNEISPRKGPIRLREFTQMEIEYFFDPENPHIEEFEEYKDKKFRIKLRGEKEAVWMSAEEFLKIMDNEIMAFFLAKEWEFYKSIGVDEEKMWFRFLEEGETPHYSKGNVDLEVETSYGIIEIAGNAYRTDYDLRRHEEFSGEKLRVSVDGRSFIPHVVEASLGVERLFYALLEHSFVDKGEKDWEWFRFSPFIAPYEVAVFPLVKKDGIKEYAKELANRLRESFDVFYKESGSIGRRYARADEIGVPYAITVDYQSLEDGSVTIRYRDDGKQERVRKEELEKKIRGNISMLKTKLG